MSEIVLEILNIVLMMKSLIVGIIIYYQILIEIKCINMRRIKRELMNDFRMLHN